MECEKSLAARFPELAAQWHPTKNGGLTPQMVTAGSNRKAWWQCERGHEWEAEIVNRSQGSGCPYCSGRYAIKGETDLATINPDLAAEWHPTKNGGLTPENVKAGSNKRVWWRCEKGHEWEAVVYSRTGSEENGCPYCSGRYAIKGETDLATINPDLAAEWHPTKNGGLTPENVKAGSNKRVWWQCAKGHEWQARIADRCNGHGCPYCAGKKVIPGKTDLATTHPELAAQWHPTLNGDLTPQMVSCGSNKKVWWVCENGHEWPALIYSRASNGCPICAKAKRWKTRRKNNEA